MEMRRKREIQVIKEIRNPKPEIRNKIETRNPTAGHSAIGEAAEDFEDGPHCFKEICPAVRKIKTVGKVF